MAFQTLAQLERVNTVSDATRAFYTTLVASENVLCAIPVETINSASYRYKKFDTLPSSQWVDAETAPSESATDGTEVTISINALTQFGRATYMSAKAKGISIQQAIADEMSKRTKALAHDAVYELVNASSASAGWNGFKNAVDSGSVVTNATNGAVLDLDKLDEALALCVGERKIMVMNPNVWGQLNAKARANGGIAVSYDELGQPVRKYGDALVFVVGERADGTEVLPFNETVGTSTTCSSVYILGVGDEYAHLIQSTEFAPLIKVTEEATGYAIIVQWMFGLVVKHPKSLIKLEGITQA